MSTRIRLASLYAGVLLASLVICSTLLYREWVVEPQHDRALLGLAPEDDVVVDLLQSVLWVGIPAILLGLGGGWLMMRKALEPVESLCNAVSAFNESNLGVRLPRTENGDEFDRLTGVFNEMAGRLEGSFNQIREFTLRASHELKTPLTVMRGGLEVLLEDPLITDHHRESILNELQEVQRLSRIVDGLALLTKSEAGFVTLQRAPVQLHDLVRDAYDDAQILARESELLVQLSRCDPAQILGDQERLRQMLLNLVDNAVKFNSHGGSLMMELCTSRDIATLRISNSGPGLEPNSLTRIFEPFYRGDAAHSREVDGSGLGLAIVRWIVGSHSGTIHAQSEPGVITTLTVHLPISLGLMQGSHKQHFSPIDPK
jgi:signal transduction histidine kinase